MRKKCVSVKIWGIGGITRVVRKVKNFLQPRYSLIIIQKLNIQVLAHSFFYLSTQLQLTLALVVPWHQFVIGPIFFIPCGHLLFNQVTIASFRYSSFAKHLPARRPLIFWKQKKSDGARSGMYGGCSKMSHLNCSFRKACVYRAVCGCALSCNRTIPRDSLPLRPDNLTSHRHAENK